MHNFGNLEGKVKASCASGRLASLLEAADERKQKRASWSGKIVSDMTRVGGRMHNFGNLETR